MRVALIADAYPPMRTSAAVQLRDLSREFVRQGHDVTMIVPSSAMAKHWEIEYLDSVQVLRLKAPKTKDIGYVKRTIGEFLMSDIMLRNFRKSPLGKQLWDGVVWYSPSIFLGKIAHTLKKSSRCRSYLIVRDLFPEWAVDMQLMGKGIPYLFFKAIASYQYHVADVIGVQSQGNLSFFSKWTEKTTRHVEVLQNWLSEGTHAKSRIRIEETSLARRKIFVYAGNMGVAQGIDILLDLVERMKPRIDIGFLFVGRGSDAQRLRDEITLRDLSNALFFEEIDPDEIPDLYAQCHVGLVALDHRHKTHNVPGKYLSYMQNGLPVLAMINPGNDLVKLINDDNVGRVCTDASVDTVMSLAEELVAELESDRGIVIRCKTQADKIFSTEVAVQQISLALRS